MNTQSEFQNGANGSARHSSHHHHRLHGRIALRDASTQDPGTDTYQASPKIAVALLSEALLELGPNGIRKSLAEDPRNTFRLLNSLARLISDGLRCQKHLLETAAQRTRLETKPYPLPPASPRSFGHHPPGLRFGDDALSTILHQSPQLATISHLIFYDQPRQIFLKVFSASGFCTIYLESRHLGFSPRERKEPHYGFSKVTNLLKSLTPKPPFECTTAAKVGRAVPARRENRRRPAV